MSNPEMKDSLEGTACFLAETTMLPLPDKAMLDQFLDQVEDEAAMLVTKFSHMLFFDVGQPITVEYEKYGLLIHEFCKGRMAFQLEPLNLADLLPISDLAMEEVENGKDKIFDAVADLVDSLVRKYVTTAKPADSNIAETTTFSFPPGWDEERRAETADDLQQLNNDLISALNEGKNLLLSFL